MYNFISGTKEYNTFEKWVPAPYIRKSFVAEKAETVTVQIACCGFYELFINGIKYTKGFLAPYISNPEHYIYYDEYEVGIDKGENVIGIILGNGFQNNPGGYIWDFDKASFRSAPMVSITLSVGGRILLEGDESFKTAPSPIRSDDYRFGEVYDANFEIEGWNKKCFDDSKWENAILTKPPCGEIKKCKASPIVKETELKPVKIIKSGESYIYDFGVSNAGVCRLSLNGRAGQRIQLQHSDSVNNNKICLENVWAVTDFWERDKEIVHKDVYICKGGEACYTPCFTYHGFRYVQVSGISDEQATDDLLTFIVFHSDIKNRGGFSCSDETVNKLQEMTIRSDLSNFHYFPTDCPQREKNGWTADVALSCEQMMLNFAPEKEYEQWLQNVCMAQNNEGALPGIVPTGGWGFKWGNGPAWDCVLALLPYYVYVYRGESKMIQNCSENFSRYLKYLEKRTDKNGLIHIGLGDWCYINRKAPKAPLEVTDTIISMDIAQKMAFMFAEIGMEKESVYACSIAEGFKNSAREHLIDFNTMTVRGECQSSQAMGLYYGLFENSEKEKAFSMLLKYIHDADDHMDVGVLGGRVIFHVLSEFGESDLAHKMITRRDFPSYGNWIERGATTLWEDFLKDGANSMNHHFWGDISAWFIKCIAGINLNPDGRDVNKVLIKPCFINSMNHAQGYHDAPAGKIVSHWKRVHGRIILKVEVPDGMIGVITLDKGYLFSDGECVKMAETGEYAITKEQ